MKVKILQSVKQFAGTLLTTLIICTILTASVAGYISLILQQNLLSVRSQTWNLAIALVEAGIEEGLQQLNNNYNNLNVDGWILTGPNRYEITRYLQNGMSYTVMIDTSGAPEPEITTRAWVSAQAVAFNKPTMFFAAAGISQQPSMITRAVKVRCYKSGIFPNALVARDRIDMNGNNIRVDSFRSCDDGNYDPSIARSGGDVASNGSILNVIDVGNANIYGHVATGPGGTVSVGNNGGVGSYEWQNAGNHGVQPGWVSDTANFTFPDTTIPFNNGFTASGGWVTSVENYSTNSVATNSSTYPNPPPLTGVVTNITMVPLSSIPNPIPPGFATNNSLVTSSFLPTPLPSGTITTNAPSVTSSTYPQWGTYIGSVITNTVTETSKNYPAPGTYVGEVTTINGNKYSYNKLTGYTYNQILSYTYTATTYSYPVANYIWSLNSVTATYTSNYYDHILYSGDYYMPSLSGSVIVLGDARLVLPNGYNSSSAGLTIKNNAKLEMYVSGSFSMSGNDVVNQTGHAANLIIYCDASVQTVNLSGNSAFTGVLVAPYSHVRFNGGGSDTMDFIGALIAGSFTLNGHFNLHYDECLADLPPNGRFLITSWEELH